MVIMTGLVVASYSYSVSLWPANEEWPAPLIILHKGFRTTMYRQIIRFLFGAV